MAVVENLSEGEAYLFAILEDLSGIDQAEFLLDSAQYDTTDGRFRAYPYQWRWWRNRDMYQIDSCVAEGELVLTRRGYIPIEEVEVGDEVWTHRNRWRPVTYKWDKGVQDVVDVVGHGGTITVTPDHPLYARKAVRASAPKDGHKGKKLLQPEKIAPEDWIWNDGSRQMTANWASPADFTLIDEDAPSMRFLGNSCCNADVQTINFVEDVCDLDWLWLFGLFLAEGSFTDERLVKWSLHPSEVEFVERRFQRLGLKPFITHTSDGLEGDVGSSHFNLTSRSVAGWLSTACGGKTCHEKSIPLWVLGLTEDQRRAVLHGYCFGDGHYRKDGCEVTTTSYRLALTVKLLANSLGMSASVVHARPARIEAIRGRTVECKDQWVVSLRSITGHRDKVVFHEGLAWGALRKVVDVGQARVYDIEVDEDHTFTTGTVTTFNCARDVGKTQGIMLNAFAFPFCYPGEEMTIVAPEYIHLEPVVRGIDDLMKSTRLTSEMLLKARGGGVKYKPFVMRFENGSKILGKIPQRDGKGVKGCVVGHTLILTRDGVKPVEDVTTDDYVWSHKNRWSRVIDVESFDDECFELNGQGAFPTGVSQEHRFFGRINNATNPKKQKRQLGKYNWYQPDDLDEEGLTRTFWSGTCALPEDANSFKVSVGDRAGLILDSHDEDFAWMVGRYVADGCIRHDWSFNIMATKSQQANLRARCDALNLTWHVTERGHSSADAFTVNGGRFGSWLEQNAGRRSENKKVPAYIFSAPRNIKKAFLDGYWTEGDGSDDRVEKSHRTTSGSASKALTMGIGLLAQDLGMSVGYRTQPIKVKEINGVKLKSNAKDSHRVMCSRKGGLGVFEDGYVSYKIKSCKPLGIQKVYNIISEDHSYLGNGVFQHNTHSTVLHFEEAQDMPKAAWTEAHAALKRGRPNAFWKAHGVTKGVQDEFWKRSQPTSEWTVHTIVAMNRLTWDAAEKAHAENEYGSQDDPDYRRNILGEHGDATSVLFVQSRFMKVVDDEPESTYNASQFATSRITDELLRERNGDIGSILQEDIPAPPGEYGKTFWMGADLGWTRDPTEIMIFAESTLSAEQRKYRKEHLKTQPSEKTTALTLVARVQMKRIGAVDQGYAFDWLVQHYENYGTVRAVSLDATGAGEPLVDILKRHHKYTANKVKGYVFGSKVLVGYQDVDEKADVYDAQQEKDSEIWKAPDIYAIDVIRGLIDNGRLWLPFDPSIVQGFVGQTSSTIQFDQYGNRRMGKGPNGHVFDAVRMAVVGWKLATIEQLTKEAPLPPVLDMPVYENDFYDDGAMDELW